MFDLATRPQPASTAAAVFGVPFDLRLTRPGGVESLPWTDFSSGVPIAGADPLVVYALQLEDTLQTAVILSLFTDARAGRDDALPLNQDDRRGWVGDEYASSDGTGSDGWGSRLWLLYISKSTASVLDLAQLYVREALAWMVSAGIAERIEVSAEWTGDRKDRLAVRPKIYQSGEVSPVYDVLWGTSVRRATEGTPA